MSDEATTRPRRRWLTVLLVVAGVVVAGFAGYALGDSSRDDDVEAAKAQAKQADKEAAKTQKALEEEQAQDEEALDALSQGFQQLGSAIEQQDAHDDQATQAAVDQAAEGIRGDLEQLGAETRTDLNEAVGGLQERINDAVGSSGAEGAQGNGG